MEKVNRRSFLRNLTLAFTILPSAGRVWKATAKIIDPRAIPNPAYATAPHQVYFFSYEQLPYTFHCPNSSQDWSTPREGSVIYRRPITEHTEQLRLEASGQDSSLSPLLLPSPTTPRRI